MDNLRRCISCQQKKPWTQEYFRYRNRRVCQPCRDCMAKETERKRAEHRAVERHSSIASGQRRRAITNHLPSDFAHEDALRALEYFNDCCAVCGRQLNTLWHNYHWDHWIPISDRDNCPGTVPHNMLPLCAHCNGSKSGKHPVAWLRERFGSRKASEKLSAIEAYFESVRR